MEVTEIGENSKAVIGERLVVAKALQEAVCEKAGITGNTVVATLKGEQVIGTKCAHPWRGYADAKGGYDYDCPVLDEVFVTDDAGTG